MIKDGDFIYIDANKGILEVKITEEEFKENKIGFQKKFISIGDLWKYSQLVGYYKWCCYSPWSRERNFVMLTYNKIKKKSIFSHLLSGY